MASVLQIAFFDRFDLPFWLTVSVTILLIWLYTFRGGIKTIVWTDSLQTLFMLSSVAVSIYLIGQELNLTVEGMIVAVRSSDMSQVFFWDWQSGTNFFKQFIAGAFTAIVMTGLDQDMMQKNLSIEKLSDAQKNMKWFTVGVGHCQPAIFVVGSTIISLRARQRY